MVEVGAFIGPVVITLLHTVLSERSQHDNHHTPALPDHLQENTHDIIHTAWPSARAHTHYTDTYRTHSSWPSARHTHRLSQTHTIYKSTQTIDVSLQTYNVVYLPEVSHGGGQRALSGDVCRITRVMIHLRANNTIKFFCIACSWNNKHMRMSIQNTKNT